MKTCAKCSNPAACMKAGKCMMAKMAKGGAVKGKKPAAVAIVLAMPMKGKGKTKMAMGGCTTKKK